MKTNLASNSRTSCYRLIVREGFTCFLCGWSLHALPFVVQSVLDVMSNDLMRVQNKKRGRAAAIKKFEKEWARTYNKACNDMVKGLKRYANEKPTPKKEKKVSPKQETPTKLIMDKAKPTPKKEKKESPKQETPTKLIMDKEKPTPKKNSAKQKTRTPRKLEMKDKAEPSPKKKKSAEQATV